MPRLERIDPLPALLCGKFVSFVGGGGKTSLAEYLGGQAARRGKRAVLTTTTRIKADLPYLIFGEKGLPKGAYAGGFARVGKSVEEGKLTALSADEVESLGAECDFVLIEADGAKRLPLKYPADYEPVIPPFSDLIVVVAGLDALGAAIAREVFRWQLFTEVAGVSGEAEITPAVFMRLFEKDALMKGVDPSRCVIFLNKYDACKRKEAVAALALALSRQTGAGRVIVASVREGLFYGVAGD
jgi:probable selenium-dependent hydroxylase accessory protein YqeC